VNLLKESFFLDPGNTDYIAYKINKPESGEQIKEAMKNPSSLTGTLPALDYTSSWEQPWLPLFMEWEVSWYPLDYQKDLNEFQKNWKFNGTDYEWN
jgi:hypothetical protein